MNIRHAPQVPKGFKIEGLRKIGNFKKIPEMRGFDDAYPAGHPKCKFWHLS